MCSSTTSRQDLFAWIPTFMLIHSAKKTAKTMLRNHTKSDLHYAYVFFLILCQHCLVPHRVVLEL